VSRIDVLFILGTTLFNQIVFDTLQTIQLTSRTPTLNALERAHDSVVFEVGTASVYFSSHIFGYGALIMKISCIESD
jgi:hypothetical protein